MPWFITNADPNLPVRCADGHVIRLRDAEIRTVDPVELAALRADPRVSEVIAETEAGPILRRWAVHLMTGKLHDVTRRRHHCNLSDELIAASRAEDESPPSGWKVYRRKNDARRWNHNVEDCKYCGSSDHG